MSILREARRIEDMSARGRLKLLQQSDGDIIVAVQSEQDGLIQSGDSVEFCTIGAGGGRSPRTLAALRALMNAIDQDNADSPISSDSPRAAPIAAQLDAEGLQPLPEDRYSLWLQHGKVVNCFTHGVGDPAVWDHDKHWENKGYSRAPLYTAEQVRQAQRDAIAAYIDGRTAAALKGEKA